MGWWVQLGLVLGDAMGGCVRLESTWEAARWAGGSNQGQCRAARRAGGRLQPGPLQTGGGMGGRI